MKLPKDDYKILNNIIIDSINGKTTEIDTLIISLYGVFVIETKTYNAKIIGDEDSLYWNYYYENKKYNNNNKLYNPIKQNKSHIRSLRNLLGRIDSNIPMFSIIVFNEEAELFVNSSTHVININNLTELIQTYKSKLINHILMEDIYNQINNHKLKGTKNAESHANYVKTVVTKKQLILNKEYLDLEFMLTLHLTSGIGRWTIEWIQENIDSGKSSIEKLYNTLYRVKYINPKIRIPERSVIRANYKKAIELINGYKKQGVTVTASNSTVYPAVLRSIVEYPLIIFSIGNLSCLSELNNTGVLVSRSSSDYIKQNARKFGEICANNNITVVSIAGKGDNVSAVKGALSKKGKVILLVPLELQMVKENAYSKLYKEIEMYGGCVISFVEHNGKISDYRKKQYYELFLSLINKIVTSEIQHKPDFTDIVKLVAVQNKRIAYLEQGNEKASINQEQNFMATFKGIRLRNKYDIIKFLQIRN